MSWRKARRRIGRRCWHRLRAGRAATRTRRPRQASSGGMIANLNGGGFAGWHESAAQLQPVPRRQQPDPDLHLRAAVRRSTATTARRRPGWARSTPGPTPTAPDGHHPARRELVGRAAFRRSDVAFTFNLLHKVPAFDTERRMAVAGVGTGDRRSTRSYSPSSSRRRETFLKIADVLIVPEHIWSKVADPVKFTNPAASAPARSPSRTFNGAAADPGAATRSTGRPTRSRSSN